MLAIALLALSMVQELPDLQAEYLSLFGGSYQQAVTIIATYQDGRPWRGAIACEGNWVKYADEDETAAGWMLPFRADARGAIVMNPRRDDAPFACYAGNGSVEVDFESAIYRITVKE